MHNEEKLPLVLKKIKRLFKLKGRWNYSGDLLKLFKFVSSIKIYRINLPENHG